MKYFLTGATGFVGSWVADQLVKQGEEVHCLVRKTSNLRWLKDLPVHYHYGSLSEPESLEEGIAGADYVLHIAGVTKALSTDEFYKGNVQATGNILEVIKAVNPQVKRVVHVSSQAAQGPSPSADPLPEDAPMQPITDYGRSKLQAEEVVREFWDDLPITILRPPAVYGHRDSDVFEVFKNIKNGLNLKVGKVDQYVSIIHVFDLARGIILAAQHRNGAGEIYNICNPEACAWSSVIEILQRQMNKKVLNIPIPYPVAYLFGGLMEVGAHITGKPTILNRQKIKEVNNPFWVISPRKIKDQLGFETELSIEEGLRSTLEWYREQGWL